MLAAYPMICVIVPEGGLPERDHEAPCGYAPARYTGAGADSACSHSNVIDGLNRINNIHI